MTPEGRGHTLKRLAPSLLGVAVAIAVVAPWTTGRVLLIDWVSGPAQRLVPASFWGLGGGATGGLPFDIVASTLVRVLGTPGSWVVPALVFPLAAGAIARLVGGSLLTRLAAALLYCVNPFVFERLYAGQLAVLLGYALIPYALLALLAAAKGEPPWRAALWAALLVGITEHFAWILVPVAVAVVAVAPSRGRASLRVLGAGIAGAAMSAYVVLGPLVAGATPAGRAGQLAAYRTASDPSLGLFANVAGLYGFWRQGPVEPKDLISGWPALLAAILVVAVYGYVRALHDPARRHLAGALLLAGGLGYLLALGSQGPTGAIFSWAYFHVPGFVVMREPEKFSVLVALAYAPGFGWGVDALASLARKARGRALAYGLALALPFAYTPNLVAGLDGQVAASHYPASWHEAARLVAGDASVLVLPWHEYMSLPFAGSRAVANSAADVYPAPVISGDDPGPGYAFAAPSRRGAFISSLVARASSAQRPEVQDAGALLAPLGVRYVVLEKVADWRSYAWLGHQSDLRPVLDRRAVEVYESTAAIAPARRVGHLSQVAGPAGLLGATSGTGPVVSAATARRMHLQTGSGDGWSQVVSFEEESPVSYRIGAGRPGWAVLPLPYEPGWAAGGETAVPLADGATAVRVGAGATTLQFDPWHAMARTELGSLAALGTVVALLLRRRPRGSLRHRRSPKAG